MNESQLFQNLCHQFREERGRDAVNMQEVSAWAVKRNYVKLPKPVEPLAVLAEKFARALREETRRDGKTGRPYRVNHAVHETKNGKQTTWWGDIDKQSRDFMQKSFTHRREQVVGDLVQLTFDCDHFNDRHPNEEPIAIHLGFEDDVDERKHLPECYQAA